MDDLSEKAAAAPDGYWVFVLIKSRYMWDDGEWSGIRTEKPWPYLPSALRNDNDDWGSVWIGH